MTRVEQGPILVEGPILNGDGNLEVGDARRVSERRCRARKHGRSQLRRRAVKNVVIGAAAKQVEAGGPCIDVKTGHPEGVVVIPEGGCALGVRVLEGGRPRLPGNWIRRRVAAPARGRCHRIEGSR